MQRIVTRLLLVYTFLALLGTETRANDSDVVNCNRAWKIVVIGSSSSFGYGASVYDSAWVGRFTAYIKRRNPLNDIVNLGIPGFTSYNNLRPDGYVPPPGRPSPVSGFNITAALAEHPDAILLNLPSNDAFNNYSVEEQQANFNETARLADSANIPLWVTTTQPRSNLNPTQMSNLITMRDWIITRFGDKSVNFFTTLANPDGTIASAYNVDNVHVNDAGHRIFFTRMAAETVLDSLCNRFTGTLVPRAGNDQFITLPVNSVSLNGSTSSSSSGISSYTWTKVSGPNSFNISNPNNAVTNVTNLVEGRYAFELTVADNNSNVKSDTVNVIVSTRVLFDIGTTTISSPDGSGKYWNNVTDALPGVKVSNAISTGNLPSGINLEVINRIDGTFNTGGPGTSTGNTIGAVGDYGNDATTDYAFAHPTATNGQWKISGLESSKQYVIKFWGTRSVDDDRIIEIKRADQGLWQEFNAKQNTDYNSAATFTFFGKTQMTFDIRVKSGSSFGYISVIDISRTAVPVQGNIPPEARAGIDIDVTLPATSVQLDGSTSTDDDGNIVSYQWTKISGPPNFNIQSPNSAITNVTNLTEGTYTFELKVTDDQGAFTTDQVNVTVGIRVLFDIGNTSTVSPDAGGKYWNNISDGLAGIKVANAISTGNTSTSIGLEIINRIDGDFNLVGPGVNTGNTAGDVGDYPNSVTTDFAFAHPSATNGQWKITGLNSSKEYRIKFWGTRTVADLRTIEIKRADENTWQSYNGGNNIDYNRAAVFVFTDKTEMTFDIRVNSESSFGYISVVDIKASTPVVNCPAPLTPAVTIAANPAGPVCQGTSVTYTATPTNGGAGPVYQWRKNGIDIEGQTGATYSTNTLVNGEVISCVMTSNNPCASTPTANSNNLAVVVKNPTSSTANVNACNSYLWNGTTYTSSGTYVFNTTNIAGCDSTATLNLNIFPSPFSVGTLTGPSNACSYMGSDALTAIYTVPITNAASIVWSVPASATILSGQGTNTLSVKFPATFGSGSVSVTAGSPCGNNVTRSIALTRTTPGIPVAINGPVNVCTYVGTNQEAEYFIAPVANAITYRWTLPPTATLVSASADSTSIRVVFSAGFVSNSNKTIKVKSISGCANSGDRSLVLSAAIPSTPGAISGPTNACLFIGSANTATYTINKVANASSYNWNVPLLGASIVSHPSGTGENDTTITVSYSALFLSGTVTVNAVSGCGSSGTRSLTISKNSPGTPSVISGPTDACPYTTGSPLKAIYTIPKVNHATSYNWVLPAGASATHPAGSGVNDTIIEVVYQSSYVTGSITVSASNGCATSGLRSLKIVKTIPAQPVITGPTDPCPLIGVSTATYTINKITGASSYTWGIPAGATAVHPNPAGFDDTIIVVTYTNAFTTGSITARADANCASSAVRSLAIVRKLASTPGVITTTLLSACPNRRYSYSIAALPSNSTSTFWSVPNGATIDSGQGSLKIYVTYPPTIISAGIVSVVGVNGCANGTERKITINLAICTGLFSKAAGTENTPDSGNPVSLLSTSSEIDVSVSPNPAQQQFILRFKSDDHSTPLVLQVADINGKLIETRSGIVPGQKIVLGYNYPKGIYFASVKQGQKRKVVKLLKL
jgi:lysophospholipase L1-like esterase